MSRRIPERYTVMIARTDKEPTVFRVQPIAVWLLLTSLIALIGLSFVLGWIQGRSSTNKKAGLQFPLVSNLKILPCQFPIDG